MSKFLLFRNMLPSDVVTLHCPIQASFESADLDQREFAVVHQAVPQRQREFLTGRMLARAALKSLGILHFPLLPNPDRSPKWPASIRGSITHNSSSCAVAVASEKNYSGIGIDIQEIATVKPRLWPIFCTSADINLLDRSCAYEKQFLASLIFSAKETFFKARFPSDGQWLNFQDFTVIPTRGEFRIASSVGSTFSFEAGIGRYTTIEGNALTSFVLPRLD